MRRAAREPSASEREAEARTCVSCKRAGTVLTVTPLVGYGNQPTCTDFRDCLSHARKVGIYCAA